MKRSAFTLVELLISLTITALVLVAAGMAFDASIMNYQANKAMSDAFIRANQVLMRMTADLRSAQAVEPSEPNSQCTMITAAGDDITYRFEADEEKIYLDNNVTSESYILCGNISSANFDRIAAVNDANLPYVKNVDITLTVDVGSFTQKACTSVTVRRNL
ncbi:MAG: prepilin-type N-terminal cleavage/methylation domain-containing protein [Phycisphaerae bacterium]|nr:prepilin-type N-terminal cleavage/methylation domain-containing protein [Phycisphaerae bacterium]